MNIILNGLTNPSKIITFNNVPTILKIDSSGDGDKAKLEITVSTGGNTAEECYIRINGYTITSTNVFGNDVSSVYLAPLGLNNTYTRASALSIVRAFQNTGLANDYNIYVDNQSTSSSKVTIEAKEIGNQYNFIEADTNATYISMSVITDGSSSDLLNGTRITLDIYTESEPSKQSTIGGSSISLPHLVTLDKNYYKDGISFDLSPVLMAATDNGNITQYNITASYTKNGQTNNIGNLTHNYCANGYSVNQGLYYIPSFTGTYFAQNVSRGTEKPTYNNSILYYVDGEQITMSFYCSNLSTKSMKINYLDSALNITSTSNVTFTPDKSLYTYSFTPTEGAYYVDVVTPSQGTVRYTNVKPLKYGNVEDYQVIYWYNSYGGISFAPLTFNKEEERETEIELYRKQNFNLYTEDKKVLNRVYNRQLEYQVTMTSHYMPKDGIWSFYDLLHSHSAWTKVNGQTYEIIITEVQVQESNVNDIYQVTVQYEYSVPDTFY